MASTFGSSEMSLRKFDSSNVNFNFMKEQLEDYLIVKGQIDPMEYKEAPKEFKPNDWMKLDRIVQAPVWMHLSESMYYIVKSCPTTFELWKTLSDTYEKKVAAKTIYLIWCLYNLRLKESDSVQAHINEYESINSNFRHRG